MNTAFFCVVKPKGSFEAVPLQVDVEIFQHLDDRYLGATQGLHQMELFLPEGKHQLTLVDGHENVLQQAYQVLKKPVAAMD